MTYEEYLQSLENIEYKYLIFDSLDDLLARGRQHTGLEEIDSPVVPLINDQYALDVTHYEDLTEEEQSQTVTEITLKT